VIGGAIGLYTNAGAPSAGTDEVQSVDITGTPTGGTFRLSMDGAATGDIAYNANAAAVQSALEAVVGTGNVAVTGTNPNFSVAFQGALSQKAVSQVALARNELTGGTAPSVSTSTDTPGVTGTHREAAKGSLLTDTTNGKLYINTGSAGDPTWTVVGGQS
jgi:hypothetical protein